LERLEARNDVADNDFVRPSGRDFQLDPCLRLAPRSSSRIRARDLMALDFA
jgi:hypothetical protein